MAPSVRHSRSLATAVAAIAAALAVPPHAAPAPSINLDPPPIVMKSKAGRQIADQGSFCVANAKEGIDVFACADVFELNVTRLSVVRPGEVVKISLPGARVLHRSRFCGPSRRCEASVVVSRLGCDRGVRRFRLKPNRTAWKVRLRPGAYEFDVFVGRFTMKDGRAGSTTAAFGVLVDPTAARNVVRATDDHRVCA